MSNSPVLTHRGRCERPNWATQSKGERGAALRYAAASLATKSFLEFVGASSRISAATCFGFAFVSERKNIRSSSGIVFAMRQPYLCSSGATEIRLKRIVRRRQAAPRERGHVCLAAEREMMPSAVRIERVADDDVQAAHEVDDQRIPALSACAARQRGRCGFAPLGGSRRLAIGTFGRRGNHDAGGHWRLHGHVDRCPRGEA